MGELEAKKLETAELYKIYKANPELFDSESYVEDQRFLRGFGIVIPGKEAFPLGYLKLYASDFIVEEIASDGTVLTIDAPTVPHAIPEKDPSNADHRALFATLVKCSTSTHDAVAQMARTLGCPVQNIHYAGLKDKHAITAQAVSFHGVPPERFRSISSPHYFLKDLRFGKGSVEKGKLTGNRFTVLVRTPQAVDMAAFAAQEKSLSRDGFRNFYWLQRFGSPRLINFQWGFDIIRGKYKECVTDFLTASSAREIPFFRGLREAIRSKIPDWQAIHAFIEPYPLILANEHRVVAHLVKHPDDHLGALQAVHEQVMLWVYAFASLLFNESISQSVIAGRPIPGSIPLLLSDKREDVEFYANLLKSIRFYPPLFEPLRPFPEIQLQRRLVKTSESISIESAVPSSAGVAIRFSLPKGEYATTFLSHLFNLISGRPPADVAGEISDVPAILGGPSVRTALDHFQKVNVSRGVSPFEEFEQNG